MARRGLINTSHTVLTYYILVVKEAKNAVLTYDNLLIWVAMSNAMNSVLQGDLQSH